MSNETKGNAKQLKAGKFWCDDDNCDSNSDDCGNNNNHDSNKCDNNCDE